MLIGTNCSKIPRDCGFNHFNRDVNSIFSKRSQSADHTITDKRSRDKQRLVRQLHLLTILKQVDTSGLLPASAGNSDVPATTTTVLNNLVEPGSGSDLKKNNKQRKHRKGKNGKKHKGRRSRRRRTRAVADDIVNLLESEHGEDILRAITGALDGDFEYSDNVEDLKKFVRTSAKKCKCSRPGKRNARLS